MSPFSRLAECIAQDLPVHHQAGRDPEGLKGVHARRHQSRLPGMIQMLRNWMALL
jgi:hypothetical protein